MSTGFAQNVGGLQELTFRRVLQPPGWNELSDLWSIGCIVSELYTGELLLLIFTSGILVGGIFLLFSISQVSHARELGASGFDAAGVGEAELKAAGVCASLRRSTSIASRFPQTLLAKAGGNHNDRFVVKALPLGGFEVGELRGISAQDPSETWRLRWPEGAPSESSSNKALPRATRTVTQRDLGISLSA